MRKAVATVVVGMVMGLTMTAGAGSAANDYVEVECAGLVVKLDVEDPKIFHIFAPGKDDDFTVEVTVTTSWEELVAPKPSTKNGISATFTMGAKAKDDATGVVVSGQGYKVKTGEVDKEGEIQFHNFYLQSDFDDFAKDIVVPLGRQVIYTARGNETEKASNWTVGSDGEEETKNYTSQIVFNRDFFDVDAWFILSTIATPKRGAYSVDAEEMISSIHYPSEKLLTDAGQMTVFQADFTDAQPYGFDDFTEWDYYPQPYISIDYYETIRKGQCRWPYASAQIGYEGTSTLICTLEDANLDLSESSIPEEWFNPKIMVGGGGVIFTIPPDPVDPTASREEQTLTANFKGAMVAELTIVPYHKKEITVGIRCVHEPSWNKNSKEIEGVEDYLNNVYRQACVKVNVIYLPTMEISFDWDNDGSLDFSNWNNAEMQAIWNVADNTECDFVIFLVSNFSRPRMDGGMWLGQRYGFVSATGWKGLLSVAHELGHGIGLSHTEMRDKDNLMYPNFLNAHPAMMKLRKNQWDSLQEAIQALPKRN
ncbi:MAG: matrixin family metalloprotease [Kiritimatiellaeota bacterium]|nr:matrixin family metalloprotease [Kiritimatiellota bacterium]